MFPVDHKQENNTATDGDGMMQYSFDAVRLIQSMVDKSSVQYDMVALAIKNFKETEMQVHKNTAERLWNLDTSKAISFYKSSQILLTAVCPAAAELQLHYRRTCTAKRREEGMAPPPLYGSCLLLACTVVAPSRKSSFGLRDYKLPW